MAVVSDFKTAKQRYVMLISVHGLIRGKNLELGRDADTGGQTKYVVEVAKVLAEHPDIAQVDVVTRRVSDRKVAGEYSRPLEVLSPKARIVRINCGPDKYLPKEHLWPHLDGMVDHLLDWLRSEGKVPDLIHGHYADAGYVAARISGLLGVPMAFTGHSLGRTKKQSLLAGGATEEQLERRYRLGRRIDAEESALDSATFVVASTQQEVDEQYQLYDQCDSNRMRVIPPGVDLKRFAPPARTSTSSKAESDIRRFLSAPEKPMVLALSRPDPKKNIPRLVEAFATNKALRQMANLVIIAGNRDKIADLDRGARETWWKLLELIDEHDLYGSVAYPKHHRADDVPIIFQLAARHRGVFVNAALTEPFGLTILEAAASGIPVVATNDGGPREILSRCKNGILVDPLDVPGLGEAILTTLKDANQWRRLQKSGVRGVEKNYSWRAHVDTYVKYVHDATRTTSSARKLVQPRGRLLTADRMLITDIDNTLIGKKEPLRKLIDQIRRAGSKLAFGVATGRRLDLALQALEENRVDPPDFLITSVGTSIHYGTGLVEDRGWQYHIGYRWHPERLRKITESFEALMWQENEGQDTHKISFIVREGHTFDPADLHAVLRRARLQAQVIFSHGTYLDLLPVRASKGLAIRYLAIRLGIPLDMVLTAGDSGNDEDMLRGNTLGVVVGNHDPDLHHLREEPRIYFAQGTHARGILEGIEHYRFLDESASRIPLASSAMG
ncbi:MAG: HAD-IIB family hydrolase [Myxococcales bacterium]|nr:HAD-IIB family hydrolase [Myxococcales bacterium]